MNEHVEQIVKGLRAVADSMEKLGCEILTGANPTDTDPSIQEVNIGKKTFPGPPTYESTVEVTPAVVVPVNPPDFQAPTLSGDVPPPPAVTANILSPATSAPVASVPPVPPVPPVVPVVVPPASTEKLDRNEVPWNAEIHSKSKKINKTGEWKVKKGADKEHVTAVIVAMQQERQTTDVPPASTPVPSAPTEVVEVSLTPDITSTAGVYPTTMEELQVWVLARVPSFGATVDDITKLCIEFGHANFGLFKVANDVSLIPRFCERIESICALNTQS